MSRHKKQSLLFLQMKDTILQQLNKTKSFLFSYAILSVLGRNISYLQRCTRTYAHHEY